MSNQSDTKFLHFRLFDANGNIQSRGGMTIAYQSQENAVRYAIARCHWKDAYVKAAGRIKAAGRLRSDRLTATFAGDERQFQNWLDQEIKETNEAAVIVATVNRQAPPDLLRRKYSAQAKPKAVENGVEG